MAIFGAVVPARTSWDILQIFDLAEEVKVNKKNMKAAIGRKLAARVLTLYIISAF